MPDSDLYGLTADQAERIRRMLESHGAGEPTPTILRAGRRLIPGGYCIFGVLTDPVAATSALLGPPTTGTLNVYGITSTGGTTDTDVDEAVYNFAPQVATTDRWTFCVREEASGQWLIDFQACS